MSENLSADALPREARSPFPRRCGAQTSTDLEKYLRGSGIDTLVVTGAVAGFCVNTTVRLGSDLGFKMIVVSDAVMGFDLQEDGLSAQTVFDVTMALLKSDFAEIVLTGRSA